MFPKAHIIYGFLFSLFFYIIFPKTPLIYVFAIFISSFLIDFDHYLYYIFHKKDFSLKNSFVYFKKKINLLKKLPKNRRKKISRGIYIFHGIESVFILLIMGHFLHKVFYFVSIGVLFHLVLDQIDRLLFYKYPSKISIIYDLFLFSKLERF